jgi:hypothetical protein
MSELIIAQVSNLCLPKKQAITRGLDYHMGFLHDVQHLAEAVGIQGYDGGYEITPTRSLVTSIAANSLRGKLPPKLEYLTPVSPYEDKTPASATSQVAWSSSHASWAQPKSFYSGPLLTEVESFGAMRRLDTLDGKAAAQPKVVFGDSHDRHGKLRNYRAMGLENTGVQIAPEVLETWGITLPGHYAQIAQHMQEQGIDKIIPDPFHALREHRHIPGRRINTDLLLDAVEGGIPMDRMHLALGRVDFKNAEDVAQSVGDLRALIKSPQEFAHTQAGEFLANCFDIWIDRQNPTALTPAKLAVVTEITIDGFAAVEGENETFDKLPLAGKHAQILAHTRAFFDDISRTPLSSI